MHEQTLRASQPEDCASQHQSVICDFLSEMIPPPPPAKTKSSSCERMRTTATKICIESRIIRVAIDVNAKVYVAVRLDRHLATTLSFGGLLVWTQLLAHCLLFSLLVERQEARPDASTRRRTASIVFGVHMW